MAAIVEAMTNINSRTADKVSEAITQSKKSVASIAEETFIARSTLQRKLAGKSEFTIDDLYAIAQALGISTKSLLPDELLNESGKAA